jgi:hypothetical protein
VFSVTIGGGPLRGISEQASITVAMGKFAFFRTLPSSSSLQADWSFIPLENAPGPLRHVPRAFAARTPAHTRSRRSISVTPAQQRSRNPSVDSVGCHWRGNTEVADHAVEGQSRAHVRGAC